MTLKRIIALHKQLNITNVAELEKACQEGAVSSIKGFGAKTQNDILQAIKSVRKNVHQLRLINALDVTDELLGFLRGALKTQRVEVAGAIRRWHQAVEDITIVAEAPGEKVLKALKRYHRFISVEKKDDSIVGLLPEGINAVVYPVTNLALGLVAYTGTPEHFALLQKIAEQYDLELTHAGLKEGSKLIESESENDVFKALHLNYIPAEIREGSDEVELASQSDFSDLLEIGDIRGMTHCQNFFGWSPYD